EAQKGDRHQYEGSEVLQFHRNSGRFKAGERVGGDNWLRDGNAERPQHFSVYTKARIGFSEGDEIRITGNGWDITRKHRLDNGSHYTIKRFTKDGIELNNGWVIKNDFGHLQHGYVTTSHASQ